MNKDSLGDRMKGYENISRVYLTRREPVIIRIDGKCFHSFTRGFKKPFDDILRISMQDTAKYLCGNTMGCKLAYVQSDEISLLLVDYENINTQPWFDNNLQKLVSVSASMATMAFNKAFAANAGEYIDSCAYRFYTEGACDRDTKEWGLCDAYNKAMNKGAMFDSRAFIIPKEEVCNYFIWRQQDAIRNSVEMLARSQFSDKEMYKKNNDELRKMLCEQKNIDWNDIETSFKRGSCIKKEYYSVENTYDTDAEAKTVIRSRWAVDKEIPVFTQNADYINQCVFVHGE